MSWFKSKRVDVLEEAVAQLLAKVEHLEDTQRWNALQKGPKYFLADPAIDALRSRGQEGIERTDRKSGWEYEPFGTEVTLEPVQRRYSPKMASGVDTVDSER